MTTEDKIGQTMTENDKPTRTKRQGKHGKPTVEDPRTHCVSVRLNDEELKLLNTKRGTMKKGEWLRCAALDKLPPVIPEPNIKKWQELGKLANNINQIAHKLNTHHSVLIDELQLNQIRQEITQLRAALLGVSNHERNAKD